MAKNKATARSVAQQVLAGVLDGSSLSALLPDSLPLLQDSRDRGLASEIIYGVLRSYWQLDFLLGRLLAKPLKNKDSDIRLLLLMAIYELWQCRTPDYAVVNETVKTIRASRKKWAASMANAVLRRFEREKDELLANLAAQDADIRYSHPGWLIDSLQRDWPDDWQQIAEQNNHRAPMDLRVNLARNSLDDYRNKLQQAGFALADCGIVDPAMPSLRLADAVDTVSLPDFDQGAVSVQDQAAQLAAMLLPVQAGQRLLDLCAAPGGKTCHLLERYPDIAKLVAVDLEETRLQRVSQNLARLQLAQAEQDKLALIAADAIDYQAWWDGSMFDCILVDAPCSASGVIRRHPDIKLLRRATDIEELSRLQAAILDAAWQMLAPGGHLLYATCSVLRVENDGSIAGFLARHKDAGEVVMDVAWGRALKHGRQLLPGMTDGFYYCLLTKHD